MTWVPLLMLGLLVKLEAIISGEKSSNSYDPPNYSGQNITFPPWGKELQESCSARSARLTRGGGYGGEDSSSNVLRELRNSESTYRREIMSTQGLTGMTVRTCVPCVRSS